MELKNKLENAFKINEIDREKARYEVLSMALKQVEIHSYYEFGVATGQTINFIANKIKPKKITGFDWFKGLPEKWVGFEKGTFDSGGIAPRVNKNVNLVHGLFSESLPGFEFPIQCGFLHIDCDLYQSTKDIFKHVTIGKGTVIVFDELWNYPQYEAHEYKALIELGIEFDVIATNIYEQVAIKVK